MKHALASRGPSRASGWRASLIALLFMATVAGCTEFPVPAKIGNPPPKIVLTFDDGPLPADLAPPREGYSADELLEPLREILATLARNDADAVFFVQGPGNEVLGAEGMAACATALREMHAAGHTLGFHAYNPDPAIWIRPSPLPALAAVPMEADLDRLVAWVDAAAEDAGLAPDEVFAPVFRQPFGGMGISRVPAFLAATARGWKYRGFRIDSADWARNTDRPKIVGDRFASVDEAEYVDFVVDRLRDGVRRNADNVAVVDVLFHVNSFTAAHLPTWVDALRDEMVALYGIASAFSVPDEYVRENNLFVDLSILTDLPAEPRGSTDDD
jgi:peptidoglycan/xylan/chitin deacetylase (PgdA/CDA1 family)